jgi:hypothetical protein
MARTETEEQFRDRVRTCIRLFEEAQKCMFVRVKKDPPPAAAAMANGEASKEQQQERQQQQPVVQQQPQPQLATVAEE